MDSTTIPLHHPLDYALPEVNQRALSTAVTPPEGVTLNFTTHAGSHLMLHVPQFLFDAFCIQLGNAYKAGCWFAARCREVDSLSHPCIERYVNIMAHDKLGLERGLNMAHITVSSPTGWPETDAC